MRGLTQAAALLLAPALARASSLPASDEPIPNAFVTLDVPTSNDSSELLAFHLDVQESDQICGEARLSVNGQPLAQDVAGQGQGRLTLEEDAAVAARWSFTCVRDDAGQPREQLVELVIESLNNEVVADVLFSARFRQVAPVKISNVEAPGTVEVLYGELVETEEMDDDEAAASLLRDGPFPGKAEDEEKAQILIQDLVSIRGEIVELEGLVRDKEAALREIFHQGPPAPQLPHHRPVSLSECDSLRCVFGSVAKQLKHAAGLFGAHRWGPHHGPGHRGNHSQARPPHKRPHHGPPPHDRPPHHDGPPPHHGYGDEDEDGAFFHPMEDDKEKPLTPHKPGSHHGGPLHPDGPPRPHHGPPHRPHRPHRHYGHGQPLFIILGLAAIAFGLFFLCGVHTLNRRLKSLNPDERRAHRRAHRRETREERLARHASRRESFKDLVHSLFCRVFGIEEAKEPLSEPQQPLTRVVVDNDDVSMEQEIARFREAASMVGDMVTAEESREIVQRGAPRAVYAGFMVVDDEIPPAYNVGFSTPDASVVADGFRYTPGPTESAPSTTSESRFIGGSANDRLGYTK